MWAKNVWITRRGVELLLGVDNSKVRRMQDAGELPFVRDSRGVYRFPRMEIERIAAARGRVIGASTGHIAGTAFELFAQGKTWQEAVICLAKLGVPQSVEAVRTLHAQFLERDRRPPEKRGGPPDLIPDDADTSADDDNNDGDSDGDGDAELNAWLREQDEAHRRAQDAFEREQHEWDEARRQRAERTTRRGASGRAPRSPVPARSPISTRAPAAADEPTPRSDR